MPRCPPRRKAKPVQQQQRATLPPEEEAGLPRQRESLQARPEPPCQRVMQARQAVLRPRKAMPCCLPFPLEAWEPEWLRQKDSSERQKRAV
jgi:hypothetical protein